MVPDNLAAQCLEVDRRHLRDIAGGLGHGEVVGGVLLVYCCEQLARVLGWHV